MREVETSILGEKFWLHLVNTIVEKTQTIPVGLVCRAL